MNLVSKLNLSVCAVSFITLLTARFLMGQWSDYLWWPLSLFLLSLAISLVIDFKMYWSFLTMRVTRHGMSLGLSVLIAVSILSSLTYISLLFDRSFDLTEEGLFSLAPQSISILSSMNEDSLRFLIFYKGPKLRRAVTGNLGGKFELYQKQKGAKVKIEYIDTHSKRQKADEYLSTLPSNEAREKNVFVFVEYLTKRARISEPFSEDQILTALINISRKVNKNIYYLTGHEELDLFSKAGEGLELFRRALKDSSFNLLPWSFIEEKKALPEDAALLMILSPRKIFFEQELKWIKDYIENKGRLFITLDPGTNHNLSPLIKEFFSVEVSQNQILSFAPRSFGLGSATVEARRYSDQSPITRSFNTRPAFFDAASALKVLPSEKLEIEELIFSDPLSFISGSGQTKKGKQAVSSYAVGLSVRPKTKAEDSSRKDGFLALLFGDSDFLSNRFFHVSVHKDLALNAVSYLTDEKDLLSLRPKAPRGTQLILTHMRGALFFLFCLVLPLLLFILGGASLFFRKKA